MTDDNRHDGGGFARALLPPGARRRIGLVPTMGALHDGPSVAGA